MFNKILIANRGEIALRVLRTCRDMGVPTVAVHSTADERAMHTLFADESVCIGAPPAQASYLNIPAILAACEITGADAVHPGYGFLAENPAFAEALADHGVAFIGPEAEHIAAMGDKIAARAFAREAGLPTPPGSAEATETDEEAIRVAKEIGYPVLVKAAAGGGGRGIVRVNAAEAMPRALAQARAAAQSAFGDGRLYVEAMLERARHVEVQVFADGQGGVVHYGERDCSLQRRRQKALEEAPSPGISAELRARMLEAATQATAKLGYRSAGTLEFLVQDDDFYFLEMNTRIQVEHPVSEMIAGVDLVREQIRIAAGETLGFAQGDVQLRGWSMECRVNAEDPWTFMPAPGTIRRHHVPGGHGVRVDSAIYDGYAVPPYYDSLLAKLIVHAETREECIMRMRRALAEFAIEGDGVKTTIALHNSLTREPDFIAGACDVHWLEANIARMAQEAAAHGTED